jgi:hypothetical protein
MRATCPVNLTVLDFITLKILYLVKGKAVPLYIYGGAGGEEV